MIQALQKGRQNRLGNKTGIFAHRDLQGLIFAQQCKQIALLCPISKGLLHFDIQHAHFTVRAVFVQPLLHLGNHALVFRGSDCIGIGNHLLKECLERFAGFGGIVLLKGIQKRLELYTIRVLVDTGGAGHSNKISQCVRGIGHKRLTSSLQRGILVICLGIPQIITNGKQRHHGGIALIHGIGCQARDGLIQRILQVLAGSHIQVICQGIVYGIIPPDQHLSAIGFDNVLKRCVGNGLGYHTGTRPHQHHVLVDQRCDLSCVLC